MPMTARTVAARTVAALVRPTARAMKWGPFVAAAGVGLAVVIVPETLSDRLTAAHFATLLRLAAACGALGVAFLLDDPATRSTPTVPTSRLVRHAVRVAVAMPVAALWWAATLAAVTLGANRHAVAALPRGALTVEAAALVSVALVLAAAGLHVSTDGSAGTLAAPALLIALAMMWFLPRRVALVLAPADPHWGSAHRRWAVVLLVAGIGFVWMSRDSIRRGRLPASR
jgi:fluoroquinolone transport system permease protein